MQTHIPKTIKDREAELIRELSQIEIISADTIMKLRIQDEQLDRINKETMEINDNLALSEKIIKKMKSLFFFLGRRTEVIPMPTLEGQSKPVECSRDTIPDSSDVLDNVLQRLNVIKSNAKTQNELLCEQNKKLDDIVNNTDDVINKISKLNNEIKKI